LIDNGEHALRIGLVVIHQPRIEVRQ
jgi:hypothetical protein